MGLDDLVLQKQRADLEAMLNSLPAARLAVALVLVTAPVVRRLGAGVQRIQLVHPLGAGVSVMKALLVTAMLALSIGPAGAVCLSHSPYDPRCTVQDLLGPTAADPQFYMQNPASGKRVSGSVRRRLPPETDRRRAWCAAAFAAQRFVNGARVWRRIPLMGGSTIFQTIWNRLQHRCADGADTQPSGR